MCCTLCTWIIGVMFQLPDDDESGFFSITVTTAAEGTGAQTGDVPCPVAHVVSGESWNVNPALLDSFVSILHSVWTSHGCRGQLCRSFLLLSSLKLHQHCSLQRPIDSVHSPLPSNPGRMVLSCRCDDSLAAPQTCPLLPSSLNWHPFAKKESPFLPWAQALYPFFLS